MTEGRRSILETKLQRGIRDQYEHKQQNARKKLKKSKVGGRNC